MTHLRHAARAGRMTRSALVCGASGAALLLAAVPSFAAEAPQAGAVEEIVVTGSRLRQDGMRTPVPVTAVGASELKAMAPTTVIEGITQLPQFYGSQSPNSSGSWFTRGGYGNLDIRGLGINRTLTLLNGRRVVSSTAFGGVDVNVIPQAMLRSVETVTGGASAAYGTDAVAGVANFILDTKFTGAQLNVQGGLSQRGDAGNYTVSGAFGRQIGDKIHILVSGEYFSQDGVHSYQGRDWYQGWSTVPDANGMALIRPRVVSRNATLDGMFVAAGSALNGLALNRDGSTYRFATGDVSSGAVGAVGARQSIANGGSGDDFSLERFTLYPDLKRNSVFAYVDYELNKDFTLFAQYIRGENSTFRYNVPRASLQGSPTGLTIFQDNAFLPESVRQVMIAENRPSITFRRMGSIEDIGDNITLRDNSVMNSATAGFNWRIDRQGLFNGWRVDGYYQYGHNMRKTYQVGLRVDRIFAAVDAVRNPATGQIVCRTTLYSNAFAGCQPLNLFGRGNASAAAVDWVIGNDPGQQITTPLYFADTGFANGETDSYTSQEAKVARIALQQHVAELSMNGEVFQGWGAGPITMAFGGAYRRENIRQIVRDSTNKSSDHVAGHPVLCNTDAAAIAAGLRGVSQPDCTNTVGVQFSKISNIEGAIAVKEGFAETQVPIIADSPLMKSLRVNLAARWADYTGSGSIWAYKGGVDAELTSSIRLRGTYSRDVRAANLSERYDKTGGVATITDPRYPGDGVVTVTRYSGGNPAVQPEKADTITAGVVLQPSFLPGFSVSADWYRIKIKGAIGQLGAQAVVNNCQAGAQDLCALVTRDKTTDRLVLVGDVFVNINQALVSGVDLEASYRRDIELFGGGENVAARLFTSWLTENSQTLLGAPKVNRTGQTGIQQSDGLAYSLPKFKATGNLTYTRGGLSVFMQGRYIGSGTMENTLVEGRNIESNKVDSAFYADLRIGYRFDVRTGYNLELYGSVTNLFDQDPPVTPYYSAFNAATVQYNPDLFDVLGRRFVIGARLAF